MIRQSDQRSYLLTGAALAAAGALLFGCKGVLVKLCYPYGISPLGVLCLRLIVAMPIFIAVVIWERRRAGAPMSWHERGACIATGLLGYHLSSWLRF